MTVRNVLVLLVGAMSVCLMLFVVGCLCAPTPQAAPAAVDKKSPVGANAGWYVCHMTYVKDPRSLVHLRNKVYGID